MIQQGPHGQRRLNWILKNGSNYKGKVPIGNIPPVEYEAFYYQQQETPAMVAGLN